MPENPFATPPVASEVEAVVVPAPAVVEQPSPVASVETAPVVTESVAEAVVEPVAVEPHVLARHADMPLQTLLERYLDVVVGTDGEMEWEPVVADRLKDAGRLLVVSPLTGQKTWLEVVENKLTQTTYQGQ